MQLPIRGKTYPLHFIENELVLDDMPFLRFTVRLGQAQYMSVIQTSHLTKDQLLSVPDFRDTLWRYQWTTHECIPLFMYSEHNRRPIMDFVDVYDVSFAEGETFWSTPKGFPRDFGFFQGGELLYRKPEELIRL